jgi:hypothetical protein
MMVRLARWAINTFLIVFAFVISAVAVDGFRRDNVHPRTVHSIWTETPEVKPGGHVVIMVLADINAELCRGEVHRWIIRNIDNQPVWSAIEPTQQVTPGKGRVIKIPVHVPEKIEPGGYYYKSIVYDRRCDDPTRAFPPTAPSFVYFRVVG